MDGTYKALSVDKTVKIKITVIQETIGPKVNFSPADKAYLLSVVSKANNYLSNNELPSDPIVIGGRDPSITNTRYHLELVDKGDGGIIFRDDVSLTFDDIWSSVTATPRYLINSYNLFYDPDNILNIFLMYSPSNAIPGGVTYESVNRPTTTPNDLLSGFKSGTPYIILKNFYKDPTFRTSSEHFASTLLHEIGHAIGMFHTYLYEYGKLAATPESADESYYDFLEDVFGNSSIGKFIYRPNDNSTYPAPPFFNPADISTANDQYTNNFMGGHPFGHYYSPMQLGRMHRNAYFLACRNFIYNTKPEDINHDHTGEGQLYPLTINRDEIWDFDIKMYNDIVVKSGATLTITCRVMMPKHANIIVEPGARLVVDGGIITSDRKDDFWYGINVWGDKSKSQDLTGAQGIVEIKNGATISNAIRAVVLGDEVFGDPNKAGGIARITNSFFINNKHSIGFWNYQNNALWPVGAVKPNRSYIQNTMFELNDEYPYDGLPLNPKRKPNGQITAEGIDGLQIRGCTFKNNMTIAKRNRIGSTGSDAIITFQANFTLAEYCPTLSSGPCPSGTEIPSKIIGFAHGVKADAVVSKPFTVSYAQFDHNLRGIRMQGITGASIQNNQFKTYDPSGLSSEATGILAYGANAYRIQNNYFAPFISDLSHTDIGTRIIESGSDENLINNNTFFRPFICNYAEGRNTNGDNEFEFQNRGLTYRCNSFINSRGYDIYVGGYDVTSDGIKLNQGTASAPAGNQFTNAVRPRRHLEMKHIIDALGNQINYVLPIKAYYYSTTTGIYQQPLYYTTGRVNPIPMLDPNQCALATSGSESFTHYVGGQGSAVAYDALSMALNDTSDQRHSLIVGTYHAMKSPYADAELSMYLISQGQVPMAYAVYDSIFTKTQYQLCAKELHEFSQGRILIRLLARHQQSALRMDSLSNTDIDSLQYLKATTRMWPRAKACAWLAYAVGEDCPVVPTGLVADTSEAQQRRGGDGLSMGEDRWQIVPNPSQDYFELLYSFGTAKNLLVLDVNGRVVANRELDPQKNKIRIEAQSWPSGVYLYKIMQGNVNIGHGKLIKN